MMCILDGFLGILPHWLRQEVDPLGRYTLQELRLRQGAPPELVLSQTSRWLERKCSREDMLTCIRSASRYSPWAAETIRRGYLTAPGGHRIGLCGLALYRSGEMTGLREISSLCIRIARDYHGIAEGITSQGSVLILGAPGWGKTTLLRDLIRQRSNHYTVSVVDERGELFPEGFDRGIRTDVLRGCHKKQGIEQVLRTMSPGCIALDEITSETDCDSLFRAAGCGVHLLATAHASSIEDYFSRPVYRLLAERGIFETVVLMTPDRKFTVERMST